MKPNPSRPLANRVSTNPNIDLLTNHRTIQPHPPPVRIVPNIIVPDALEHSVQPRLTAASAAATCGKDAIVVIAVGVEKEPLLTPHLPAHNRHNRQGRAARQAADRKGATDLDLHVQCRLKRGVVCRRHPLV